LETVRFAVDLSPGRHKIRVKYLPWTQDRANGMLTRYWQVAYLFNPARKWAKVDRLEVHVELPTGWLAASEPALQRQGDRLTGVFPGVPADVLMLTAQAPEAEWPVLLTLLIAGSWIVAAVGVPALAIWLGRGVGRWTARQNRSLGWAWLLALLMTLLWGAAFLAAVYLTLLAEIPFRVAPHQAVDVLGRALSFLVFGFLGTLPIMILGPFLTVVRRCAFATRCGPPGINWPRRFRSRLWRLERGFGSPGAAPAQVRNARGPHGKCPLDRKRRGCLRTPARTV